MSLVAARRSSSPPVARCCSPPRPRLTPPPARRPTCPIPTRRASRAPPTPTSPSRVSTTRSASRAGRRPSARRRATPTSSRPSRSARTATRTRRRSGRRAELAGVSRAGSGRPPTSGRDGLRPGSHVKADHVAGGPHRPLSSPRGSERPDRRRWCGGSRVGCRSANGAGSSSWRAVATASLLVSRRRAARGAGVRWPSADRVHRWDRQRVATALVTDAGAGRAPIAPADARSSSAASMPSACVTMSARLARSQAS